MPGRTNNLLIRHMYICMYARGESQVSVDVIRFLQEVSYTLFNLKDVLFIYFFYLRINFGLTYLKDTCVLINA